jgi:hypothetical protein
MADRPRAAPSAGPATTQELSGGAGLLLHVVAEWGTTLRVAFLMAIPVSALVVLAVHIGPVGATSLVSAVTVACSIATRRAGRRRRNRTVRSA